MLPRRSDSDRSGIPADVIFNPGRAADGHVAGTGHVKTTSGEDRCLVVSRCQSLGGQSAGCGNDIA